MRRLLLAATLVTLAGCAHEAANGRPWVRNIHFYGVEHVSKKDLESKLEIQDTSWVPFSPKKYLDPFAINLDAKRIVAYYHEHGYFSAQVTAAEAVPAGHGSVNVDFTVNEGPPTRISAVSLTGSEELPAKTAVQIKRRLKLKVGQIFDYDRYTDRKAAIERALEKRGYAWAKTAGEVKVDRDTQKAAVALHVTPGPASRFGSVRVTGTKQISPELVRIHAGIPVGRPFSPAFLADARNRVYNLGVFSQVRVDYAHDPAQPTLADVTIQVEEGKFHELQLGGGLGLESQRTDVHLEGRYTKYNFLGGLRTLRLRLRPAFTAIPAFWNPLRYGPEGTLEATFTQPDFLLPLLELRWTVGFDLGIDYAYQNFGPRTTLGLSHPFWHDRIYVGLAYTFQFLKFFHTDPTILNDPAQAGTLFGYVDPYRLGWLEQTFSLDLRDHPLDPHAGAFVSVAIEEAGTFTGGAFDYVRILPDARGYIPLGRRLTLALRVQFGDLFVTGGALGSPITRRFYLGGPDSHRGFNYNRLSLQVPSGESGVPPIPIGGDEMVLFQAELRANLFRLAKYWVTGELFADAGDVSAPSCGPGGCTYLGTNVSDRLGLDHLYYAVGPGLAYKTIVGIIRLDLGIRLNRLSPKQANGTPNADPGDRFAFHISVGNAF